MMSHKALVQVAILREILKYATKQIFADPLLKKHF